MVDANLPEQFVQRVVGVRLLSEQAEKALRDETDRLMKVQVQISQTRNQIDDVLDLLNTTEAALRDQLFVIDSPPIWRVLHVSDFRDSWQQVPQRIKGVGARTGRFYQVYRSKLLVVSSCLPSVYLQLFSGCPARTGLRGQLKILPRSNPCATPSHSPRLCCFFCSLSCSPRPQRKFAGFPRSDGG